VILRSGFGAWSPDGKRLAIPYGRGFGVFAVDGTLIKEIPLTGFAWLRDLEWSRAGDRVLVWTEDHQDQTILWSVSPDDAGTKQIVRVDRVTGARTVVTRFPFGVIESGSVSRDGREIVCSVREDIADAWIIEGFDPRGAPRVPR
jgi:hypothetical protein